MIGLAPTNAVVADLRKDGYAHAATLHRELGQVERDPTRWDRKTVITVDEAAMMDNGIMAKLLKETKRSGARLILAGYDRQFAPVAKGDVHRARGPARGGRAENLAPAAPGVPVGA